jgi:hypothetical protein
MQNSTLKLSQLSHFASNNVNSNVQGISQIIPAGTTVNIDFRVTDDSFITGGILLTDKATFGDKATFQVIDIDNIIGYGNNVVLGQYITNFYMCSDKQEQINESMPYPAKIIHGLYLRIAYTSTGVEDVNVAIMYRLHKALY